MRVLILGLAAPRRPRQVQLASHSPPHPPKTPPRDGSPREDSGSVTLSERAVLTPRLLPPCLRPLAPRKASQLYHLALPHPLPPALRRYINDACEVTQEYPHNPNGSPEGIAALCSPDGRHLAMMPHPERCFVKWQCPWAPPEWEANASAPWLRLFQNAAAFCASTQ